MIDRTGSGGRLTADAEGLSIYYAAAGKGYLLASSQGSSTFVIYGREVPNGYLATFAIAATDKIDEVTGTDGIDVMNLNLGPAFPEGVFVTQDDVNPGAYQNFKLVPWGAIARSQSPALLIDPTNDPRGSTPGTGGNTPPRVNAGPDQAVPFGSPAFLNGTVGDDGKPSPPAATSKLWSVVSGPGSVTFGDRTSASTSATLAAPGVYILRLTADDGAASGFDDLQIEVWDDRELTFLDVRLRAGRDDAEESAGGKVILSSSKLELVLNENSQTVGLRFQGLEVPQGAAITNAYVQFKAASKTTIPTTLVVQGEAADDAAAFVETPGSLSSRLRTVEQVSWAPPTWKKGARGAPQRTPDIAPVIREITTRPGWSSGRALVIIISGEGMRVAVAFEGGASGAPLLHVEYR